MPLPIKDSSLYAPFRLTRAIISRIGLVGYVLAAVLLSLALLVTLWMSLFGSTIAQDVPVWKTLLVVLPPAIFIAGLLLLPFMDRNGQARADDIDRINRSEFLLHWHYTQEQWQAFLKAAKLGVMEDIRLNFLGALVVAFAGGAFMAISGSIWFGMVTFAIFAFALSLTCVPMFFTHSERNAPPGGADAWVTPSGIYANGVHHVLNLDYGLGYAWRLSAVSLREGATALPGFPSAVLEFTVIPVQSRIAGALAGSRNGVETALAGFASPTTAMGAARRFLLPVPPGKEAEAQALIARLSSPEATAAR